MKKLTLNAEREVIQQAKRLATERGTSVSAMFSEFVRALARGTRGDRRKVGPVTRRSSGILKLPRGKTDRQLVEDVLRQRHGL